VPAARIAWHARLEARVALGVSALVALSLGAILFATTRVVTNRSLRRASEDLDIARGAFDQSLLNKADSVAALTRLVTELPVFRAHLVDARLSSDAETIGVMVDGYRRQLNAQFAIVTDASGTWLASPGWPEGAPRPSVAASIRGAQSGRPDRAIASVRDEVYLVVSEPARFANEVLGTMTVGYVLDDAVALELAKATHCQVNLVSSGSLRASSLPDPLRGLLAAVVAGRDGALAQPDASSRLHTLGKTQFVGGTFPLFPGEATPSDAHLVLLQDWNPTQQFVDQLRRQFLAAAGVVFACALVAGYFFSRRMSQPLKAIAAAAGDIAAGNLTRQLPVQGSAEASSMAVAFNEMSASLRAAHERLVHDAIHDHLTELPNRTLFIERLDRAISRRARHPDYLFAVLFVDLDRFKTVNDSLGHPAGDRLLIEIARRLDDTLRREDMVARSEATRQHDADATLARLGGDEFTILVEDIGDPSDAVRVAERILATVARPVQLDGQEVFATASIGIAVSGPTHRSGEDVVRDADLAMYRAKASGGDQCAICDATMHHRAVERLRLESDLRHAVERQEFVVHYQPIVAFRDRRVVGFEALVRWQHPERGLLLPAAFLEVAEETSLITRIDEWVLREACGHARQWQDLFPDDSPPSVSVNISGLGFGRPDLAGQVAKTLADTGLDPRRLRIEITEGVAMADAERTRTTLMELRALGMCVSLDDFGTGYSSLSYLQRLPVDTLKIDRSFVHGLDDGDECREIIQTIVNLARTLRLDVVAEGAETAEQVRHLEALECRCGQGYFFHRPMPFEEVVRTALGDRSLSLRR
jgi:diguanylate cyclase (GGDEF)-like protein